MCMYQGTDVDLALILCLMNFPIRKLNSGAHVAPIWSIPASKSHY